MHPSYCRVAWGIQRNSLKVLQFSSTTKGCPAYVEGIRLDHLTVMTTPMRPLSMADVEVSVSV